MPDLKTQLTKRLHQWFDKAAVNLRSDPWCDAGQFTITLRNPCGDDDNTLCLEAVVTEKTHLGIEGCVEGVKFDAGEG